jgi:hypothetical protein
MGNRRRLGRGVLAASAASLLLAACSSDSLTNPSGASLPLSSGRYVITLLAADFAGSGAATPVPACPGSGAADITTVSLELTGRIDGDVFDATASSAASGTVRLHLMRGLTMVGGAVFNPIPVTGWLEGTGTHQNVAGSLAALPPNTVRFDGRASLRGELASAGVITYGTVTGTVSFANPDGVEVRCNPGTVTWSMSGSAGS